MKKIILILIIVCMASIALGYDAQPYDSVDLVLTDGYTAQPYNSVDLVLGATSATCSITTDTTFTSETVDCTGETFLISNSATVKFINSDLLALNIAIESGSSLVQDDDSSYSLG